MDPYRLSEGYVEAQPDPSLIYLVAAVAIVLGLLVACYRYSRTSRMGFSRAVVRVWAKIQG